MQLSISPHFENLLHTFAMQYKRLMAYMRVLQKLEAMESIVEELINLKFR